LQRDLGYAREILAKGIGVGVFDVRTKAMKPDLLIKAEIGRGAFTRTWISRVIETRAVRIPCQAASGGSAIDVAYHVRQTLAGCGFIYVNITGFATTLRK
jgi:hypothetical protein